MTNLIEYLKNEMNSGFCWKTVYEKLLKKIFKMKTFS